MDDWSVRSSSVPNTPIVETAPLELHPMQDDYDETMSSGTFFLFCRIRHCDLRYQTFIL